MTLNDGMRLLGCLAIAAALSATACKEDEPNVEVMKDPAMGDAEHGARGPAAGHTGRAAGPEGASAAGDIDALIGGDSEAGTPRDYGQTMTEANWRPEGLRVAYSGPKLPCDGSLILKPSPIDDLTAAVHVVDVNENRVPIDCMAPTTLSIILADVPRTVGTIRFYGPDGTMQTVSVIGATPPTTPAAKAKRAKKH
jgi:hypothetical protein